MIPPVGGLVFAGPHPAVMGHRGAPRTARENTPASFAAAAAAGATWVELDVRRAVGDLVVCHDPVDPLGATLIEQTAQALRDHQIATLDEVLATLPGGLGVDIELKNLPGEPDYDETDALAALVAPAVRAAAAQRPVMVSSFNPSTMAAAGALLGGVRGVGLGLLHGPTQRAPSALALVRELGASVLCAHLDAPGLDAALIDAAHAHGVAVLVWTVDDPSRARAFAAAGVDAICTNDPAGVVAALREVRPPR